MKLFGGKGHVLSGGVSGPWTVHKMFRKKLIFVAVLIVGAIGVISQLNIAGVLQTADQSRGRATSSARTRMPQGNPPAASPAAATSSLHPSLTSPDDAVYARRRQDSQALCRRAGPGSVSMWTRYNSTAYCILPKVGCTFWKGVFRFLHGDTGGSYTSPSQIPRIYIHTGPMRSMRIHRDNGTGYLQDSFRFMFVREPYSRLLSAFIDKLLLPDFWHAVGKPIARLRHNASNARCGSDISFKEFAEFVTTQRRVSFDNHWKPTHTLCSTCLFRPHVIGKMETFAQDVRYVLRLMNSSWMLDSYNHHQHVLKELDMITRYNFAIWRQRIAVSSCASRLELCRRLWRAFQINGYIPSDWRFPDNQTDSVSDGQFLTLVQKAYRQAAGNNASQLRRQKEDMMMDAYRTVSSDTMEKLKRIYEYDFLMFGYDPEPAIIFQDRKETGLK